METENLHTVLFRVPLVDSASLVRRDDLHESINTADPFCMLFGSDINQKQ